MIPYTAYDIIRAVNHEVDLTRHPVREHRHGFGDDAALPRDDRSGGGGHPAGRSRLGGLAAAARALTARGPLAESRG